VNVQQLTRCMAWRRLISIPGASLILLALLLSVGLSVIVYASDGVSLKRIAGPGPANDAIYCNHCCETGGLIWIVPELIPRHLSGLFGPVIFG